MSDALGRGISVLGATDVIKERGSYFLSLHIQEEYSNDYNEKARTLCDILRQKNCRVIADISPKALRQFNVSDPAELAELLHLYALRIDYGFSEQNIIDLAKKVPVVINASTATPEMVARIKEGTAELYAMHNFYPRLETGLDGDYLRESTDALHSQGVRVLAFIPGDRDLRGPIYEGLPTLEAHRGLPPLISYIDLAQSYGIDDIYVADMGLSEAQEAYINDYIENGVIDIPCELYDHENLYDMTFTNRPDSPAALIRFTESREYSCSGQKITPKATNPRPSGTITIDNELYMRYSGEVQLTRADFPADHRVNVIGRVDEKYLSLPALVKRGQKLRLVHADA